MNETNQLSLDDLIRQKADLERQIKQKIAADRKKKIADILADMQAFDISVDDLAKGGLRRSKRSSGRTYINPETGAVWSGMGKRPNWIREALDKGIDIETFRA